MTKKRIDRAIKHLNMEIIKYAGYSIFTDLTTGHQIGEMVCVCYLKQLTLEQWVEEAKASKEEEEELAL